MSVMEPHRPKRVELLLPVRTVLVVGAAIALMAAFVAIGDTFLLVFVGIFLALVFEYPGPARDEEDRAVARTGRHGDRAGRRR